ncbi:MAG: ADP-ribosyltransferase-containing protein, partial [Planctomycetota bacterium]
MKKAFHGTRADIDTFQPLSHFGTKKAAERALESVKGKGKAKIISAELTIKNPLEVKDTVGVQEDVVDWVWQAEDKGVVTEKEAAAIEDIVTKAGDIEKAEVAFVKLLKSKGYDGLKYINQTEDKGSVSYVVFGPEQVSQPPAKTIPQKPVKPVAKEKITPPTEKPMFAKPEPAPKTLSEAEEIRRVEAAEELSDKSEKFQELEDKLMQIEETDPLGKTPEHKKIMAQLDVMIDAYLARQKKAKPVPTKPE